VKRLRVEVVYALADVQHVVAVDAAGKCDGGGRARSGAPTAEFAGIEIDNATVGVFGTVVPDRSQRLNEGDRVEIYRPLTVDPMTARRLRASRRREGDLVFAWAFEQGVRHGIGFLVLRRRRGSHVAVNLASVSFSKNSDMRSCWYTTLPTCTE
jgi:putative ubiquitin-RnfH superfamily antitoxin RatB of RatAB toxin-antitoxin module